MGMAWALRTPLVAALIGFVFLTADTVLMADDAIITACAEFLTKAASFSRWQRLYLPCHHGAGPCQQGWPNMLQSDTWTDKRTEARVVVVLVGRVRMCGG